LVDTSQAVAYLTENHNGVLATFRRDGMPQLSPVTVGVDDAGRVMISTRAAAMKVRNLQRDPRVSLCVTPPSFIGEWIQVEGRAEIVELPAAMDLLVELYRRIRGEHPDWDEFRQAMSDQQRVIIRFAIDRAGPTAAG